MTTGVDQLRLVHAHEEYVGVEARGADGHDVELARYVYRPGHPQFESPKPYFHPMRTLGGEVVSCYRPWDHIWHKGLQLALPHVGDENFWGGPTFVRDRGYQQLANNGAQEHCAFTTTRVVDGGVEVGHTLDWRTEKGEVWLVEERSWQARLLPAQDAWTLRITTSLHNVRGSTIAFGSPTTNGRPAAGYGGLFWRGPRSFTGGRAFTPQHDGAEQTMGQSADWLAYVGRHDENLHSATVVFVDHPTNPRHPTPWFVRSDPYAAVCPAPFFSTELDLPADDTLTLSYDVVIAGDAWDADRVAACVASLST